MIKSKAFRIATLSWPLIVPFINGISDIHVGPSSFFQELKKEPKKPLSVTTGVFVYHEFYDRCISARCAVTLGC